MTQTFQGWGVVAANLRRQADEQGDWLNEGQRASLRTLADRIPNNGVILADEVGMGKTRIAVSLVQAVKKAQGRVAILVPPGLGFQWQDELRKGGIDPVPTILRSLWGYLEAWSNAENPRPWYANPVVMLSHAFSNWRLSESSQTWRWELLPMLYAICRKGQACRLPRGFFKEKKTAWDPWVKNAAEDIYGNFIAVNLIARGIMQGLQEDTPWPGALQACEYTRNAALRPLLEKAVGLGLGVFDLLIIDEAHKSRGQEGGLERLICNIILTSGNTRRLAMTATPVELDPGQWRQILRRICASDRDADEITDIVRKYADAVRCVRSCWRSNAAARTDYAHAANRFQAALFRYLLRRDKRRDDAVRKFIEWTGQPHDAYRQEREIKISPFSLSPAWRQIICAAESLSFVTDGDNVLAKRLRLTVGNGHGLTAILDDDGHDEHGTEIQQPDCGTAPPGDSTPQVETPAAGTDKRQQRAEWWRRIITSALASEGDGLFDHPAILAVVQEIETYAQQDQKVLVFGRFTRPLDALTKLLNARAMLRALGSGAQWLQSKVHEDDWAAVNAARRQLDLFLDLAPGGIDAILSAQYQLLENRRERLREHVFDLIEKGLNEIATDNRSHFDERGLLQAARNSENATVPLTRALDELMESPNEFDAVQCARAFVDLMAALRDRNEGDTDGDNTLDETEARDLWPSLEERLSTEYGVPSAKFARFMYGATPQSTRRMLQLGFNRAKGTPSVLVAQSMIGREGLNLHQACKVVVLLHPEWNPGVVEQQIGRVDRVGSRWARELDDAILNSDEPPVIEIRPVIFLGTYDEHNWKVLRERWDDLRAQLHGIVVPARERTGAETAVIDFMDKAAPNFYPQPIPDEYSDHLRRIANVSQ